MFTRAAALMIDEAQKQQLESWARAGTTPQRVARKCEAILLASQGVSNHSIAQQTGLSRPTVLATRAAFSRRGCEALRQPQKRQGSRRVLTSELEQKILDTTLNPLIRIGVFDAAFRDLSIERLIELIKEFKIEAVELASGNDVGNPHCDREVLVEDESKRRAYAALFDKNNIITSGATAFGYYMAFGGTNWGWLAQPNDVYTSYDYGAAITESRQLTAKYDEFKRQGYFATTVAPLTKTDIANAPLSANPVIATSARANPDTRTQFVLVRPAKRTETP